VEVLKGQIVLGFQKLLEYLRHTSIKEEGYMSPLEQRNAFG
jgi:hypothetical protein